MFPYRRPSAFQQLWVPKLDCPTAPALQGNRHAQCRALPRGADRESSLRTGRHFSAVRRSVPRKTHRLRCPTQGGMGNLPLPNRRLGRPSRVVPGLRFPAVHVPQLPQPPLPKCQSADTAAWVAARQEELLPVPYFHNVFTLPHEFNPLILYSQRNQCALLGLLFDATAQTLLAFGQSDLGGKVGFTLVLHTWDQRLRAHFHLHCLIASGALSPDGSRWIAGGRKFLFPVHGLSKIFRGKYLDGLAKLLRRGQLDLPPLLRDLVEENTRRRWLRRMRKKPWVVYSQAPFAGPRKLLDYLGRYTHRVAISNHRLLSCEDGQVCYHYRDRCDGNRLKNGRPACRGILAPLLAACAAGPLPPHPRTTACWPTAANRSTWPSAGPCSALNRRRATINCTRSPSGCACWGLTSRVALVVAINFSVRCCHGCSLHRLMRAPRPRPARFGPRILPDVPMTTQTIRFRSATASRLLCLQAASAPCDRSSPPLVSFFSPPRLVAVP